MLKLARVDERRIQLRVAEERYSNTAGSRENVVFTTYGTDCQSGKWTSSPKRR